MPAPIFPPPVQKGDVVAVVAPASPVDPEALSQGICLLEKRYTVVVREDIHARNGYLAGDDARRIAELQHALNDENIRAVIAARGGYGTSGIIDRLDFRGLLRAPKWIAGSSDLTALSTHLFATFGLVSIHGPMVTGFHRAAKNDVNSLFDLLEGALQPCQDELKGLFSGRARGPLLGGNLTVLAHMAGTLPPDFTSGAILFLEDVSEKPYRLDRCLTQLHRSGILRNLAGIVLGEFTDCPANSDGVEALDVMKKYLLQAEIPAAAGYPAAHGARNAPFVHGKTAVLEVEGNDAKLSLPE